MYHVGAALQIFCQSVSIWMVLHRISSSNFIAYVAGVFFFLGGGGGGRGKKAAKARANEQRCFRLTSLLPCALESRARQKNRKLRRLKILRLDWNKYSRQNMVKE